MPQPRKGERVRGPYFETRGRGGRWRLQIVGHDGRFSTETVESEEAGIALKRAIERQLATEALSIHSAIQQFLVARGSEVKAGTLDTYKYALRAFFPDDRPLWSLTAKACEDLYETFLATPRLQTKKPPSADYGRNVLAMVKTFFRWVQRKRWLSTSPVEALEGRGRRRRRKVQLSISHLQIWNEAAQQQASDGDTRAVAALCALWLGQRAGEIVGRRIEDLANGPQGQLLVQIPTAKTEAGERLLEVAEPLAGFLRRQCGERRDGWLFPSTRSKSGHRGTAWVRKAVQRICRAASVPEVGAHAMRGSNATLAATVGMTSDAVAAALGHASPQVTERHYAAPGAFAPRVHLLGTAPSSVEQLVAAARKLAASSLEDLIMQLQELQRHPSTTSQERV